MPAVGNILRSKPTENKSTFLYKNDSSEMKNVRSVFFWSLDQRNMKGHNKLAGLEIKWNTKTDKK
jgi:hypothetical protein